MLVQFFCTNPGLWSRSRKINRRFALPQAVLLYLYWYEDGENGQTFAHNNCAGILCRPGNREMRCHV